MILCKIVSMQTLLEPVIDELIALNLTVRAVLADAPQRALLKACKSHSGYFVST